MAERRFYSSKHCIDGRHASCPRVCASCGAYCVCRCHEVANIPRKRPDDA